LSPLRISLLQGFDAMGVFLDAHWERGGRKFVDLAVVLGSARRNIMDNGPPLDRAYWSDWLDAILACDPSRTSVAEARADIKADWSEFLALLKAGADRPVLDEYRARKVKKSWHRVGDELMTSEQAYDAMRLFLLRHPFPTIQKFAKSLNAQDESWQQAVRSVSRLSS
jgi:hypothetical protein